MYKSNTIWVNVGRKSSKEDGGQRQVKRSDFWKYVAYKCVVNETSPEMVS